MEGQGNFGERQEGTAKDWGFHAHLSIYRFAADYVRGRRCLEIGCGTGYGSRHLRDAGAASLVAIDKDEAVVARLRGRHPTVDFLARDIDLDGLGVPARSCDLVFSSNVFEHLAYPDRALADAAAALADDGLAIIAVPPITTVGMLAENARNVFHVNNIPTWAWTAKLGRYFHAVRRHRHWVAPRRLTAAGEIDRARCRLGDFTFPAATGDEPTITAIFVAERPRRPPLEGPTEAETCPAEWRPAKVEADARQAALTDLKRQLVEIGTWAADNRHRGVDAGFIVDSVCRQLQYLTGRAA